MGILVRSVDDGGGILWFEFGRLIRGSMMLSGTLDFTPGNGDEAEWGYLTDRTRRIVEAILPLLPDPSRDNITVFSRRLGVDLGATRHWEGVFPEIVRIIGSEIGDADVEMSDRSHSSTSAWLASLIESL